MEKDIQSNSSESAPSTSSRLRAFGRQVVNDLFGDEPRYSEADRIELIKQGTWVGETTWFIPGMASNLATTFPHDFPVEALEPAELKAAIDFKMISRAALTQVAWDNAQEVSDKAVPNAALSLIRKLEAHPTKN